MSRRTDISPDTQETNISETTLHEMLAGLRCCRAAMPPALVTDGAHRARKEFDARMVYPRRRTRFIG